MTSRDASTMTSDSVKTSFNSPVDLAHSPARFEYDALSISDLLDAREQYHVHLMRHPNVVATAIGYYRIRHGDTPPGVASVVKGTGPRTLTNSEVRSYSWPAILIFVEEWVSAEEFAKGHRYSPDEIVPRTLYLPDGRRVPVCTIEAPRDPVSPATPPIAHLPLNNIGSGHPVFVEVQGRTHIATIACIVTDGHKTYGLTNRHVTGEPNEELSSQLGGRSRSIGSSSSRQATRVPFSEVYPTWPGKSVYINMDAGLIDINDVNDWTAKLQDGTVMGPMLDLSAANFSMSLLGGLVRGYGASSGQWIRGEIQALFYRYKSKGGFEYVSDFFIGPRTPTSEDPNPPDFVTLPGDSGTLWLLEPVAHQNYIDGAYTPNLLRPFAIQWGANRLYSGLSRQAHGYALATCLSTVCDRLDIDIVRDWNLDQADTWGAVGHFSIASRVGKLLSSAVPALQDLMKNNSKIISHDDQTILHDAFSRMGDVDFIPMADVPDFFWKHGHQHHSRGSEGPNHFADMDQKRNEDGVDLLKLCEDPNNIDPNVWNNFYSTIEDLLHGGPIAIEHRGLLPFRVWQIFDQMVEFVRNDKIPEFVCAAGVLTHYIGDACQPLHISYLHDGDPTRATKHSFNHVVGKRIGASPVKRIPLGVGIHEAYEDDMVNFHRQEILDGLDNSQGVLKEEYIASGFEAAKATIDLMRETFNTLPPEEMLETFLVAKKKDQNITDALWGRYGRGTIAAMQNGTHLLAVLWESAWIAGRGEGKECDTSTLKPEQAMAICASTDFLRSCTIVNVGQFLSAKPSKGKTGSKNKPK
jgi:hypothetical protein